MSFLSGPECSTGSNPLSQFTKHVHDDKSLQRDRVVGSGPGGIQESFRSQRGGPSQYEALQDFLQNGPLPERPAHAFAMDQLRQDLDGYRTKSPQTNSPVWGPQINAQEQANMEAAFQRPSSSDLASAGFSPGEFQRFQQSARNAQSRTCTSPPPSRVMPSYQRPMGMDFGGPGAGYSAYRPMPLQYRSSEATATASKGKERMVELDDQDWEQEFAQMDTAEQAQDDLDAEANAAIEEQLDGIDRSVLSETNEYGDFESIWRGIQAETSASRSMLDEDRMHLSDTLPLGPDFDTWSSFDQQFARPFNDPQLGNYMFEQDNIFDTKPNAYELGQQIILEGGNLSLAALAFEAAVQQNPNHTDAWVALGSVQAQNEKETPAIRALEQALKLDPENLEALMGLAISYTNDGWDSSAYRTLERWLATKYPAIISPDSLHNQDADISDLGFTDREQLHERVTSLFIRAAQLSPSGTQMDPDVQVGLGVLFYGQEEYGKAVDCFNAALASSEQGVSNRRSEQHLLWNRLGATLANSGRSEEATDAYYRALELKPNFVRARYNLGVSCINMNLWPEAAGHLLGAMAMHRVVTQVGADQVRDLISNRDSSSRDYYDDEELARLVSTAAGANESSNLLETLRRVFGNMGRKDLVERVLPGMDVEAFRGEFDF
ncbi:MAG: hypothetical protein Q9191_002329 [Dirinaria sp. TL-2023a]